MKSGSLGKLTTRPNTWELLYNNSIDTVCTFDIYITNKENRQTGIDLLITPIPIHLLPAHEADYLITNKLIEPLSSYDKKGIVIGEFDYVYVRSQITVCVVSVNGFIDELSNDIGTTAYYQLVNEGGRSSSGSNTTNFVLITENVADATNVPYTISGISLSRIQSIFVNGVSKTVSLTGNFITNKNYSVLKVVLADNELSNDGEMITITSNGLSVSKLVNVSQTVVTPTYNLIPSAYTVNEGVTLTLTLMTTNVANNVIIPFTITGTATAADYTAPSQFSFNVQNNVATVNIFINNDTLTELGANETLIVALTGVTPSVSTTVSIIDTSKTPAGSLIGTYTVGTSPQGITYDPTNNAVWVANSGTDNVTKLNAATGAVIGTYAVDSMPRAITYDTTNNAVWVANSGTDNVTKLNAATGAVIGTYAVGTDPRGITYDPTNNAVWVSNHQSNSVTKLNAATGAVIGTYAVGDYPSGITYDPTNNAVWVVNVSSNSATKLNAATGAVIGTYAVGGYPQDITYDPTNNAVWVANSDTYNVTKLNAATGAVIGTYAVGDYPRGITYDPTNNAVWVVNVSSNSATKLNAATGALVGTYTVGTNPRGITYDPTNNAVWVSNHQSNSVTKLTA